MRERTNRVVEQMSGGLVSVEELVELGVDDVHMRKKTAHPFLGFLILLVLDVHIYYNSGLDCSK